MNRKVLYLIITLLVLVTKAYSQTFTLQGRVTDANMNPIELASVQVVKQGKASLTSLKGEFSMQLQSEDSVVVVFSMIGYKSKSRVLRNPRGKQTLQVVLNEEDYTLKDVTVTEMKRQTGQTQELKKENMKNMPSTTGNAVEEMIQMQAGVSTHNELSSQYNVRGGSFDENSVYIMWKYIVLFSFVLDSKKDYPSLILTWLKRLAFQQVVSKQNMETRCHQHLTSLIRL